MKKAVLLLVAIVSTYISFGQIVYQNEGYSLQELGDKEFGRDYVRVVTKDFIITSSGFPSWKYNNFIAKYDRNDLNNIWRVEIPGKLEYQKWDLDSNEAFYNQDGSSFLILWVYDKKNDLLKFFLLSISSDGEKGPIEHLTDIPLEDKYDYSVKFANSKSRTVILVVTDYNSSNGKVHSIWLNDQLKIIEKLSIATFDNSGVFQSILLHPDKDELYFSMLEPYREVMNVPLKRDKFLYKFSLEDKKHLKRELTFDEFELHHESLEVNPNTGDILLFGFVGKKRSSNIGALSIMKLNPHTLEITFNKFSGISMASVEKLKESKHWSDKLLEGSNSARFKYRGCFFLEDGDFYVAYENVGISSHSGVFILRYNKDLELVWQDYFGNSGYGKSLFYERNGQMVITSAVSSKFMNKVYPDIPEFRDNTAYHNGVVKFIISPDNFQYEVLVNFNGREHWIFTYIILNPDRYDDSFSTYIRIIGKKFRATYQATPI